MYLDKPSCYMCGKKEFFKTGDNGEPLCRRCASFTTHTIKNNTPRVTRNQKCPCGSGLKFKRCCR